MVSKSKPKKGKAKFLEMPLVRLCLISLFSLLIGLLISLSGASPTQAGMAIAYTGPLIGLLILYVEYPEKEQKELSTKAFNDFLPVLVPLIIFVTLAQILELNINSLINILSIEFVLFLYLLVITMVITVLRLVIFGIILRGNGTKRENAAERTQMFLHLFFNIFAILLALIPIGLYQYNTITGQTAPLWALLAVLISFMYSLKNTRKLLPFVLYCFTIGISIAIILSVQKVNISLLIPNVLTVLGIIASAALLIALEAYKNEREEVRSHTLNLLLSGILSLLAVLIGIILLFNYNNQFYVLLLSAMLIGSIICSFSILFIELVVFGIIIKEEFGKGIIKKSKSS